MKQVFRRSGATLDPSQEKDLSHINFCCPDQEKYTKKTGTLKIRIHDDQDHYCFFCNRPVTVKKSYDEIN